MQETTPSTIFSLFHLHHYDEPTNNVVWQCECKILEHFQKSDFGFFRCYFSCKGQDTLGLEGTDGFVLAAAVFVRAVPCII